VYVLRIPSDVNSREKKEKSIKDLRVMWWGLHFSTNVLRLRAIVLCLLAILLVSSFFLFIYLFIYFKLKYNFPFIFLFQSHKHKFLKRFQHRCPICHLIKIEEENERIDIKILIQPIQLFNQQHHIESDKNKKLLYFKLSLLKRHFSILL
jgi:hypothetical protein